MKKKNMFLTFVLNNKISYIFGLLFLFSAAYIQTKFPKILGETIDILKISNFSNHQVKINILYMLLIAAGTFICTYSWRNLIIGNSRKLECYIRELLFAHLQKMSAEFYNRRKTGDLIAYAINDIGAVRMTFGPATAMSINGISVCIAAIYAMTQNIDWRLTVMCLAPIPFIIVIMLNIGKLVQKRFKRVQECFAAISDRVQENIYGIRVIKAYVQEDEEVKNFEDLNNDMMDSNLEMVKVSSLLSPIIEICFSISFVLNLIIGGNMVLNDTISLGSFVAFNTYLTMIMNPILSIGRIINVIQRGMASYKRLDEIFKIAPDITDGESMINKKIQGKIAIRDLSFFYPNSDEKALDDINITLPKGNTLGVIGKTGSGKTTLANLLLKLYNTESGKIFIDDIDINDYALECLREGFGYVPQDNFLFSSSIKDNITFFKSFYSQNQIEEAAKASCIYDSIVNFPQSFDTILGERGINLSGGQRQRTSIARAIVKNPSILILDDSLSAVDTITERKILDNLKSIRADKTAIIITHKISSVKYADEIIVLDHGKIIERGTHEELLSKGGSYYDIYCEQSREVDTGFQTEVS